MSTSIHSVGGLARRGVVLPVRRDPTGRDGPTPWAVRGGDWRRSGRGWYVPSEVELTTDQRIAEAAVLLPQHGGVTGWAGLHWQGAAWFGGDSAWGLRRPVPLVTAGSHIRAQPGVSVSKERLDPRDLVVVDGMSLTTACRSTWFEMRHAVSEEDAAVVMSMAAYSDLVSLDEMAEWEWLHPGWNGAPRCRGALPFSVENAWSPQEARSHYVWRAIAELPPLLCNAPLFDRHGQHFATPDLVDVEAGVVIEYDGPTHAANPEKDERRDAAYRAHNLELLIVVGDDFGDRWALARRMASARRRASHEAESMRTWTPAFPSWWIPTHTVALRRELPLHLRPRVLRYREVA